MQEVQEMVFEKGKIIACKHHFIRKGINIECVKCLCGYYDPLLSMPIDEINEHYEKN